MRRIYVLLVFFVLLGSSVAAGIDSLVQTGNRAQQDVNRALTLALRQCEPDRIDADTIRVYRSHIQEAFLRDTAFLSITMTDDGDHRRPQLKASTGLTLSRLWALSDQRASCTLLTAAILWLLLSLTTEIHRNHTENTENTPAVSSTFPHVSETCPSPSTAFPCISESFPCVSDVSRMGSLCYDKSRHRFTVNGQEVHFTPMQHTLMELFMAAPDHTLLQQDICNRLWPKKPDASATLYTLIRRLKPQLHDVAGLHIECNRGQSYQLKDEARGTSHIS